MERPTAAVDFGEESVKSQVNEERERERPAVRMERGEGESAGGEICGAVSEVRFGMWAYRACVVGDACVSCGMLTTVRI